MSFRDELRTARQQVDDATRQERLRSEQERLEREGIAKQYRREAVNSYRKAFATYVTPNKHMVERLLRDLGDETWGRGNYDITCGGYESGSTLMHWYMGKSREYFSLSMDLIGNSPYFQTPKRRRGDNSEWLGGPTTNDISESELRKLLKNEFLAGPHKHIDTGPSVRIMRFREGG